MGTLTVKKMAGALGAELSGVDLAKGLNAETAQEVRQALLDHLVIVFRDQELTPEQFLAFAQWFGEPAEYPLLPGIDGFPMITEIVKLEHERSNFGGIWHADTTYLECPPMGSMLNALEIPPYGGDTLFANQYLAYESLSAGMKSMLAGLRAVHSDIRVAGPAAGLNARRSIKVREDSNWRPTESLHPVVRTHPETGRKCLFVNHSYSCRFENMTERESKPLLDFLMDHGHRPEFTCRFRWEPGSIAFWDNRCTKHLAIHDAGPFHRRMQRTQIAGDAVV